MVDEMRVQRLLRRASDVVDFLDSEASADERIRAQRRWLDSVKYNFVVAIECCVDVGQHLCAVQGWGPPATNADTFRILATHSVLTADLVKASMVLGAPSGTSFLLTNSIKWLPLLIG